MRRTSKQNSIVKKVMALLPFCLFIFLPLSAQAQKYTDHVQQSKAGQGTVTITQSKEITDLVNGQTQQPAQPQQPQVPATPPQATGTPKPGETPTDTVPEKKEEPKKRKVIGYENNNITTEDGTTIVDTRKKVMRNARKVTGYRIQAYAGGNTRADRVRAEQAGSKLKTNFPDQPVYVHFYSPRWICRMGNFRDYGEASRMLAQVKKLGYKQACIVKGQITVQY